MKSYSRLTIIGAVLLAFISCSTTSDSNCENKHIARENIEWLDIWAPHTNESDLPRVLLLGHSITRLYGPSVDSILEGKAYVTRLATSKSLGDPAYFDEVSLILRQYDFDIIHVSNGAHGWKYSIDEYSGDLEKLYLMLKSEEPEAKLIWATNPPMPDKKQSMITKERNESIMKFLKGKDILLDDTFSVLDGKAEYYEGTDGVHPNETGVKALAEVVAGIITENI